ncbi:DUF2441 domain-containing protein [Winslowiella arboricola]|uniref:DUF2441 domain-containing protein n=1 Tax=Winslowiella arboricola TaxID=2978220 RepID=UPI00225E1C51|nr:DUF2441 domain-containing protein [Winslowiella arboricola]MCU5775215.1 DUF2441 domain-containing protein [Winslowiella arboricola]
MTKEYFHIQRLGFPWTKKPAIKVGDVIKTEGFNPFFEYYNSYRHDLCPVNNGAQHIERLQLLENIALGNLETSSQVNTAKLGASIANHFILYSRELIFESVRAEKFSELPSRQKCIWVAEGQEGLKHWQERLKSKNCKETQVFRVEIDGKIHTASEENLPYGEHPHSEMLQLAENYWLGTSTDPRKMETFFEGTMKVLDKIL